MTASLIEAHPLFLPEDEDGDPVAVSEVQICRIENGQKVFYPRIFPASDLQSLEQVVAELGGGIYELIARHEHRITTRRKVVLPGKPKPMYDEGRQEPAPQPVKAPELDPMSLMMGGQGGMGGIMPLIMLMFQQQQQSADRQTQMFMAMMQGSRDSSVEEKAAARAELAANVERERINSERQMSMMREVLAMQANRGSGNGEDFTKGVEFMRSFATQQIEFMKSNAKTEGDDGLMGILDTVGQALQAANALGMFKSGPLPEGVVPPQVSEIPTP